jgi:stalled ribosome rescue protein Dom34
MSHFHALVWIDHREARILHFSRDESEKLVIKPDHPARHIHHHANTVGSGHEKTSAAYLHDVVEALVDAGAILITGPGAAKVELMHHMQQHHAPLAKKVAAVETVDHPTDGQLVAYARKYFKSADLDTPQIQH